MCILYLESNELFCVIFVSSPANSHLLYFYKLMPVQSVGTENNQLSLLLFNTIFAVDHTIISDIKLV